MEEKILLVLEFGSELARMWIAITFLFGGRIKRIWAGVTAYALFAGFLFFGIIPHLEAGLIMWGVIMIVYFVTTQPPALQGWKWKIRNGFLLLYQEELICLLVNNIIYYRLQIVTDEEKELLGSALSLIIIIIAAIIYNKYKEHFSNLRLSNSLKKNIIPMVVFVVIELILQITSFNYIVQTSGNERHLVVAAVLSFLSMISIGLLVIMVFYIKDTNDKMEKMLIKEKQMQEIQVQYYETLLKKEEETRKYRHDMNGHLVCLHNLIQEGNIEEIKTYIQDMQNRMQTIRNSNFDTGIKMLDSILNYYVGHLEQEIAVTVNGKCRGQVILSDMDVCTIFDNLIKNAIEAIQSTNQPERFLTVYVKSGNTFVKVEIKNSTQPGQACLDSKGNLKTTKKDRKNHGLGMLNVQEAVQKNRGTLSFHIEDRQFCCQVTLPIRQQKTE